MLSVNFYVHQQSGFICLVTQVDFWCCVKKGLKSTWSDKMALSTKMRNVKKHELESIICTDVKWEQRAIGEKRIGKKVPQTALKWFLKTPSTTDTSVKNCGCNNGNKIYGCISKWIWKSLWGFSFVAVLYFHGLVLEKKFINWDENFNKQTMSSDNNSPKITLLHRLLSSKDQLIIILKKCTVKNDGVATIEENGTPHYAGKW